MKTDALNAMVMATSRLIIVVCLFSFFFRKKKSGKSALYIETEELREAAATGFVRLVRVRIARREVTGFDRLHHIARLFLHRVHADGPMPVDVGDERPERLFDIRRVQCGCLDVSRRDLHRTGSFSVGDSLNISRLGVAFGIVGEDGANMPLIGFITDQNDRTVHAGIRSDFVEPRAAKECVRFFRGRGVVRVPLIETLECRRFENVEDEQSTERIAIVGFGNGHETFLTGCERERQTTTCVGRAKVNLPVSHNCTLIVLPSTCTSLVENSTPMVDRLSSENSLRVKRDSRFDLPTPESPVSTILKM